MHRIYLGKRCIITCNPDEPALSNPDAMVFHHAEEPDIPAAVALFKDDGAPGIICIPSDDEEGTYRCICRQFKEVNAAGGLVSTPGGDCLLIRRFGLWDLPKGHQEEGEEIGLTALREVMEETGLQQMELRDLICVTDHCYLRDGIWHLKHTWWYDMMSTGPSELFPQGEEDISEAVWVEGQSIKPLLEDSYPSIKEVFEKAGF